MVEKLLEYLGHVWHFLVPFVIVDEYQRGIVLRLGKFHRKLEPGLHWVIPAGIEQPLTHSVVPSTHHLSPQSLTTGDGKNAVLQVVVTWRCHDIRKMLLEVEAVDNAMSDSVYGVVAEYVAKTTWADLSKADALAPVKKDIRARAFKWGIEILQVSFSDMQCCRSFRVWQDHKYV